MYSYLWQVLLVLQRNVNVGRRTEGQSKERHGDAGYSDLLDPKCFKLLLIYSVQIFSPFPPLWGPSQMSVKSPGRGPPNFSQSAKYSLSACREPELSALSSQLLSCSSWNFFSSEGFSSRNLWDAMPPGWEFDLKFHLQVNQVSSTYVAQTPQVYIKCYICFMTPVCVRGSQRKSHWFPCASCFLDRLICCVNMRSYAYISVLGEDKWEVFVH